MIKKNIKNKSINAIIVKPNQIGSLLKVKEVIDIAAFVKGVYFLEIESKNGRFLEKVVVE